jgi:hypothetical protein
MAWSATAFSLALDRRDQPKIFPLANSVHRNTFSHELFYPFPSVSTTTIKPAAKGDPEAKAVAVSYSSAGVLADASEITGLPRDNFEVWEISKEEFEAYRPQ